MITFSARNVLKKFSQMFGFRIFFFPKSSFMMFYEAKMNKNTNFWFLAKINYKIIFLGRFTSLIDLGK